MSSIPPLKPSGHAPKPIQAELDRLVENGSLEEVDRESLLHAAPVFGIEKPNGKIRLIHDLRELNEVTVERRTFRLFGIKQAVRAITTKTWMCKVDLTSGYNQIAVREDSRPLLGVVTKKKAYQFRVLGFGWTASPWIFQTIMIEVGKIIMKRHGVLVIIYLDDFLFLCECSHHLAREMPNICQTMQRLGLVLNLDKSETTPAQSIGFLGITLDAARQQLRLTSKKARRYAERIDEALKSGALMSDTDWLSLLGKLSVFAGATTGGFLRLRSLQSVAKTRRMVLSDDNKNDLRTWRRLLEDPPPRAFADLRALWGLNPSIDVTLTSDAAENGWGATACKDGKLSSSQGQIPPDLGNIMEKELYGAEKALKLLDNVADREVTLFSDNTAVVAWLNKQGSAHASDTTMTILKRIQQWKEANRVQLRAVHTAGHLNVQADRLSRFGKLEWLTPRGVLEAIQQTWGPLQIDATAGPEKELTLPGFVDEHWTRAENGLGRDWRGLRVFVAPPWATLTQVATKIQSIRDPTTRIQPRNLKSCVVAVFPDLASAAVRVIKTSTRYKMYFSIPAAQFKGMELERLADKTGKIRLIATLTPTYSRP